MTTLTPGRMAAPLRKMDTPLLVLPLVCAGLLASSGRALGGVVAEKKFNVVKMESGEYIVPGVSGRANWST